jgi:hypothetical protein
MRMMLWAKQERIEIIMWINTDGCFIKLSEVDADQYYQSN